MGPWWVIGQSVFVQTIYLQSNKFVTNVNINTTWICKFVLKLKPKKLQAWMRFEPMTSAILAHSSTNWAIKPTGSWSHSFIIYLYVTSTYNIHICHFKGLQELSISFYHLHSFTISTIATQTYELMPHLFLKIQHSFYIHSQQEML